MNPMNVENARPGLELWQAYPAGTLRVLAVECLPLGFKAARADLPTNECPSWRVPDVLEPISEAELQGWRRYARVGEDYRLIPTV